MELNWSTFLLEILNFLVLVWILKRFFYKPLQEVIARRQQEIEARVAEAEKMRSDAQQLQQQYEGRQAGWENERQQAREVLQKEIKDTRARLEDELQESLQQQRQRAEVVAQRQRREQLRQLEQQAVEQGGEFAARLLQQSAGPDLESRLLALLLDSLGKVSTEQLNELREAAQKNAQVVEVASAFPLPSHQRDEIASALAELLEGQVDCHFVEAPELIAGLRIAIGAWVLGANVRDELHGFSQLESTSAND
ncbi:F0F1 ATP synthase subunit delta [Microbulbifer hainanensis]|uniref:F0F1 ATP synthase subunit delta n=1 Tax=Microbulbifer hainanensis TaxID=2735675 RepID=UPI001866E396|nr:F0F1 ATP synthase subunit delta [Microbulbifer hainanensis]